MSHLINIMCNRSQLCFKFDAQFMASIFYLCVMCIARARVMYLLQSFFFNSVNFCFSLVLNSLAYITIPKNNGKIKIN